MTKVVKFGGSSLASAEQFKKVKEIITAESSRRFVVPSAPGKRFSNDTKVTDMLYGCYDLAAKGKDFSSEFDAIKERYYGIINDLGLDLSLEKEFETIKACFIGKAGRDYAASRGEPKTASICGVFTACLKTPTNEALIAQVGPPDCATAIFIIINLLTAY